MKKMLNRSLLVTMLLAVAVSPSSSQVVPPAPTENTPFSIGAAGMTIQFKFLEGKYLRMESMLPIGVMPDWNLPERAGKPARAGKPEKQEESGNEVLFQVTGDDQEAHHGLKLIGGEPGMRLEFVEKREQALPQGKEVVIVQKDPKNQLLVESYYDFNNFSPTVRRYTRVTNQGTNEVGIDYLSSAALYNFGNVAPGTPQNNLLISYAYNSWKQEAQWRTATPSDLGWCDNGNFNLNGVFEDNIGSWSTIRYLPLGMVQNVKAGVTWFWQIEHNGTWHWELSNTSDRRTYLYLGGPDAMHGEAWKSLKPGETYQTVPVALGCVRGGFDEAVAALTQYRRNVLLRSDSFTQDCPVMFNDYMNCLTGNPTTEKELPLINAAARAGCQYYTIDAGWYAELKEGWWDAVGAWEPSKSRFPGGLERLMDAIRSKGMIPGIWVEPEVVGIKSPLINQPDNWFLMRHGKRIIDHDRYMLDFRNPEVRAHMTSVVERLIKDYGIGYFKFDYNNSTWGTDLDACSAGQGLLDHNRAVVAWLKEIRDRHPGLVIENCGSGGCRMDYAMLSQAQIQSSSDQSDYQKYPAILVGELAAVLPEQLGIWSYPVSKGDAREASFNMVNAMAGRIQLSGRLSELSPDAFQQVQSGIQVYKTTLAPAIPHSIPFFPLGMPSLADEHSPIAVGLRSGGKDFLFVWRLEGDPVVTLPAVGDGQARLIYPASLGIVAETQPDSLRISFPAPYMGAIVEVDHDLKMSPHQPGQGVSP